MKQPIFFNPIFKERVWGGEQLRAEFDYEIPSTNTGECWAISAHENGSSTVSEGEYKGKTLTQLWESEKELFGNVEGEKFPLLIKILDANADLSVQVHPDDEYGVKYENGELGKTECWYIIDCDEDAEMIYGHNASSKEELNAMIQNNQWDDLLRRVKIKPGDFYYVESGTIHALCKGTLVLETQQNSDTTYRLYDYDRKDSQGNLRELHLKKAIDVTKVPHTDHNCSSKIERVEGAEVITFVENNFFTVQKWSVDGKLKREQTKPFQLVSVISGEGTLQVDHELYKIKKGNHFLLPSKLGSFEVKGNLEMIASYC
ncbi:mannose-6-phosphate isomerase, class I [Pseudalkalibacillus hwajinpoensis]|uniref:mannose-6-phosphate isomerase, class I n=1 Tax=Guptibacillus hwajinpoensis TaxID=208199 RepID=UPI001CFD0D42|nr:mannose-6-phosphate isomerase, class I [Pseudalkalibacillus hwajinpoensis]